MPNPFLTLLIRGNINVNPGVLGAEAAESSEEASKHPSSKKGAIIGIAIGVILLIILGIGAYCVDKRRKNKAARGIKTAEVGGTYEEVRPLAAEGYPMGFGGQGQGPMVLQPGGIYQPPQPYPGVQGGYPLGPQGQVPGQQGTEYYRNQ